MRSAVMAPSPGPFFIFCSPCLQSFSIRLSHSLAPHLSAHCLQAEADSENYPSALLLPGQFSCEPLVSAVLEMKEGWKDALGVWDQREATACFSFDLDTVQVFFHLSCFSPPFISVRQAMCETACVSIPYLVFCLWSGLYQLFSFYRLLLSFLISFFRS